MGKWWLLGLAAALGTWAETGHAQCDPGLRPAAEATGYRDRDGRCEGVYVATVSAPDLDLISLTRGPVAYPLEPGATAAVRVPELPAEFGTGVRVRAVARPLRTYYRMDASAAPGQRLVWPVDEVLRPLQLTASRVGVFAWCDLPGGRVFVPVQVTGGGEGAAAGAVELVVRPSVEVGPVLWRLTAGDAGAAPGSWVTAAEGARMGEAVTLRLPDDPPGRVTVEVAATTRQGGGWVRRRLAVFRD